MNVSTLRSALPTKSSASSICIHPQANKIFCFIHLYTSPSQQNLPLHPSVYILQPRNSSASSICIHPLAKQNLPLHPSVYFPQPTKSSASSICVHPLAKQNLPLHPSVYVNQPNRSKIVRFIHLYTSPSQTQDEFQIFRSNLEVNLHSLSICSLFLTTVIGDSNAKFKQ